MFISSKQVQRRCLHNQVMKKGREENLASHESTYEEIFGVLTKN